MSNMGCKKGAVALLAVLSYCLLTIAGFGPESITWVDAETTDAPFPTRIRVRYSRVCWEFGDVYDRCDDYTAFRRQFSSPSYRRPERNLQMTQNIQKTFPALIVLQVFTVISWVAMLVAIKEDTSFCAFSVVAMFVPVLFSVVLLSMVLSSNAMDGKEWSRIITNNQWEWDASAGAAVYLAAMPLLFLGLIIIGCIIEQLFKALCSGSGRSPRRRSPVVKQQRVFRKKEPTVEVGRPGQHHSTPNANTTGTGQPDAGGLFGSAPQSAAQPTYYGNSNFGSAPAANPYGQPSAVQSYGQAYPTNPYGEAVNPYANPANWTCQVCTVSNPPSAAQCTMCTSARVSNNATPNTTALV